MSDELDDFSFGFVWFWVAPELAVDRYGRRVDYLIQCALKSPAFMSWILRIPADERPVIMAAENAPDAPYRATVRRTKSGTSVRILRSSVEYGTEDRVLLAMLADRDFEELLALVAKRWKLPPHPPLDAARVDDLDAWFPIS